MAFSQKKSEKLWVLRGRNAATCEKLLDEIGLKGRTFLTDDWEVFHKLIPEDQLFTRKDLNPVEHKSAQAKSLRRKTQANFNATFGNESFLFG